MNRGSLRGDDAVAYYFFFLVFLPLTDRLMAASRTTDRSTEEPQHVAGQRKVVEIEEEMYVWKSMKLHW